MVFFEKDSHKNKIRTVDFPQRRGDLYGFIMLKLESRNCIPTKHIVLHWKQTVWNIRCWLTSSISLFFFFLFRRTTWQKKENWREKSINLYAVHISVYACVLKIKTNENTIVIAKKISDRILFDFSIFYIFNFYLIII